MRLLVFFAKRIFQAIFVLLGLSILIFVIARIMPGDPARTALGARAPQWVVDRLRKEMHLNDPIYVQYGFWLRDAVRGDFGFSLVTRRSVADDIIEFFPASLELALYAGLIMGAAGITLGTLSAQHKDKALDNILRVFSYMGVVIPSFVWGILLLLLFGFALQWLPTIGRLSRDIPRPPNVTGLMTIDAMRFVHQLAQDCVPAFMSDGLRSTSMR